MVLKTKNIQKVLKTLFLILLTFFFLKSNLQAFRLPECGPPGCNIVPRDFCKVFEFDHGMDIPENVSAIPFGYRAKVSWNPVVGASDYRVSVSFHSEERYTPFDTVQHPATEMEIDIVTFGRSYFFVVQSSADGSKWSKYSQEAEYFNESIEEEHPSPEVATLGDILHFEDRSISWTSVATAGDGYDLEVFVNESKEVDIQTSETEYLIGEGLYSYEDEIYFRVRTRASTTPINNYLTSVWKTSVTKTAEKLEQTAPPSPTIDTRTETSIILSSIANGEYRIAAGDWQDETEFTGLTQNTAYTFEQRYKEDATQKPSPASSTSGITSPGAPTGLSASIYSETALDLSWTEPNIGGGAAALVGYKIERQTSGGDWSTIVANTGNDDTTYRNTGLTENTQYGYRVSTITTVASSAPSNVATSYSGHCVVSTATCQEGYTSVLGGANSGCATLGPVQPYTHSDFLLQIISQNETLTTTCSAAGTEQRTRIAQRTYDGDDYAPEGAAVNCITCQRTTGCAGGSCDTWYKYDSKTYVCGNHPSACTQTWDTGCGCCHVAAVSAWNRTCSDQTETLRWCCRD